MRAVAVGAAGPSLEDRPVPAPPPGEALVRVLRAGICDTDLQLLAGYMGYRGVLGHEFVGRVEAADGAPALLGRTVVGEINVPCRGCPDCRRGLTRHCPGRTVLGILGRDGAFAEYLALPFENLHPVDGLMSLDRAVFVEPVAAAFEIPAQVPVAGRRALVVGCGKLGSIVARVLRLSGAEVTAMARDSRSLVELEAEDFAVRVAGEAPSKVYDLVVDATGSADGFAQALGWVRPRGTLILKTTTSDSRPLQLAPVVIDEIAVVGSRCGPFRPAIEALARGDLEPERTIGGRFRLEEAEAAFAAARSPVDPGRRKVVFLTETH